VTLGRGRELPLGLSPRTLKSGCGHVERNSPLPFRHCWVHGQFSGLDTRANRALGTQGLGTATRRRARLRPFLPGRSDGFADATRPSCQSRTASRHPLATARSGASSCEPLMASSSVERPACTRARTRASSAERASRPPAIARSFVGGAVSVAHWVPQRQHASSWRAIGAAQERHKRGKCRSRMAQRSFPRADRRSRGVRHSIRGRLFRR
jgi:hypothetical protein